MSLIYNGTAIPNTGIIRYNGTELSKVIYNGITVWEKQQDYYLYNRENPTSSAFTAKLVREEDALTHTYTNYVCVSNEYHASNKDAGFLKSKNKINIAPYNKLNVYVGYHLPTDAPYNTCNVQFGLVSNFAETRDINECSAISNYWIRNQLYADDTNHGGVISINLPASGSYYFYAKGFWAYYEIQQIWFSV